MRVEPLGLEKHLMPVPVGEAVDLVLDRRAIARTRRADRAGEQRRTMEIVGDDRMRRRVGRSEEHTSELQSLMRISYAVFCLKKKHEVTNDTHTQHTTNH